MSRPTWGDEVSEALGSFSLWIFHYFLLFFFFRLRSHNFYFWILLLTFSCSDEIPPTTIVGPDSNGIKTVTEYYIDEDGKKFKVFFLFFFLFSFFFSQSLPTCLLVQIVRRIKVKKVTQVVNHDVARRKVRAGACWLCFA